MSEFLMGEVRKVVADAYDRGRTDALDGVIEAIDHAWANPQLRLNKGEVLSLLRRCLSHVVGARDRTEVLWLRNCDFGLFA